MQPSLYIRYASPCIPTRPRLLRPLSLNKLAPTKELTSEQLTSSQEATGNTKSPPTGTRFKPKPQRGAALVPAKPRPYSSSTRDIPQRADCYPSRAPWTALSLLRDIPRGACPYPAPCGELAQPFAYPSYSVAPRAAWGLSPSLARAAVRGKRAGFGRKFLGVFARAFGQFKKRSYLCSANGAGSRPRAIEIITRK